MATKAQGGADKKAAAAQERAKQIEAILKGMEEGNSLRKCCVAQDISTGTFLRWVDADKELQEHYAGARARMLDAQAEALEEIGDEAAKAETAVEVAGLRLKSDNRKWLLSKLAPKKYGEKVQIGGDEEAAPIRIEAAELSSLSGPELDTLKKLLAKGKAALEAGTA